MIDTATSAAFTNRQAIDRLRELDPDTVLVTRDDLEYPLGNFLTASESGTFTLIEGGAQDAPARLTAGAAIAHLEQEHPESIPMIEVQFERASAFVEITAVTDSGVVVRAEARREEDETTGEEVAGWFGAFLSAAFEILFDTGSANTKRSFIAWLCLFGLLVLGFAAILIAPFFGHPVNVGGY
ncbi:hypothetical protein ACFVAJ_19020 [Agromyces sp. NPDC057679]|uniref:hypothetical protein n=1 Tax=Agromyces sp. NPDC057679 TaxID=3346207 RepID=UPI003672B5C1